MAVSSVRVVTHNLAVQHMVKTTLALRLKVAATMLAGQIKRNIGVSTRSEGPSQPGDFPHKDSGNLQQSIQAGIVDMQDLSVSVGAHVDYALGLELGTDKVAARPFLRRTFNEMLPKLKKLF